MANLYGIELSQEATNDEQSTSSDVSSTSGTALALDQLYLGTISSSYVDTVDTDLYNIDVIAGQTYILGYSYDGNVIGWNAQSYNSTDTFNYNFRTGFTLSDSDGATVATSYLGSFNSGGHYSFTAETTGTLSLLIQPSVTSPSDKGPQDYGLFVKSVDTDGMESMLRGAVIGSVFSDDVTLHLAELDALDNSLHKTHLLSGNDQVLVDFQNTPYVYATIYLDEGNDSLSITNDQKLDFDGVLRDTFNALTAYGGEGDDSLTGGRGDDNLIGGSGDDTLDGGDGDDTLKGDCYNGDLVYCTSDSYDGVGGVDTINGGAGKDVIVGGTGADLITGGADTDLFVFEVNEDFGDTITDFEIGSDKIALFDALETSDLAGKTFGDIVNLVQSGNDTIVQMSLNATAGSWVTVATLQNIQASSLTQDSFHGLTQITGNGNTTSSTTDLYGIELSQEATNDEQSTSSDVSSTSGTALALDQLYLGTISSSYVDTVDTDLYNIDVIAGQTYILGYSYDGNVIGWNAQSYNSTDTFNYNFRTGFTLSDSDGATVATSYLGSFNSGGHYSFTAETTGTLSLLIQPSVTSPSDKGPQDYGLFVKSVDTDGMESMLRGAVIGSVFSDDVTLHLAELDALDNSLHKTHLLSGNDQVLVDFQNTPYVYATIYLDEGNDSLSITNDQKLDFDGVLRDTFNALTAYGGEGDDSLTGGRGDDNLIGGSGDDTLDGGDGDDTLKGDCYNGDLVYCTSDSYDGVGGVDTINGGAGKDVIVGGTGADLITGGADTDLFVFEVNEDFGDTITDFEIGSDKIALFDALETSDLAGKTFGDIVNLVQSGNDTIVQMSLNATAGSWVTVATLQNIQASSLTQESFHGLDKMGMLVDVIQDFEAPSIALISSTGSLAEGETATVTFTLSETSTDFTASDVTVSGGTLTDFSGSDTSYTAIFTPRTDSTADGVISVASNAFTDAAGNANDDGADANNTVTLSVDTTTSDTTPPTISISSSISTLDIGDTSSITFTLSETSSDFTASDVTVSGGTLTNFSGSDTSYTAIFTPHANSTTDGVISVASGKFTDAAGNPNNDGSDVNNTVTLTVDTVTQVNTDDVTPPTIDYSNSQFYSDGVVVEFDEEIKFGSGEVSIFQVDQDRNPLGSDLISSISIEGTTMTALIDGTFNTSKGYQIVFDEQSILDLAGNDLNYDPETGSTYNSKGWTGQITNQTLNHSNISDAVALAELDSGRFILIDSSGMRTEGDLSTLAPTNTQIVSAELEEITGDAVDISDVIGQLRHIVGLIELTGLNQAAADNDANGSIDISDVISSLRQIVGLQEAPNARIVDAQGNHQFRFDESVTELYLVAPGDADLSWTPLELV